MSVSLTTSYVEYNAPPPVELTPPAPTHVAPVAPPQAAVENPAPVLPGTPALLPSVQAPAPSVARNPNLPIVQPPSVNNPPSGPIGSGIYSFSVFFFLRGSV